MAIDVDKFDYIASPDDPIEDAWTKFESNRHRSIIVVEEGKVIGTLSDGDIRKAILKHRFLSTPVREVMNINFICVQQDQKWDEEKIFKKYDISLIPVVDENLMLIDIIVR